MPAARASYLRAGTPRFRKAHAELALAVKHAFPQAKSVFEWGMPAWRVPRPADAPRPARAGTIDPNFVFIGLVERRSGITLHLWYPGDYALLDKNRSRLRGAGFRVMRGCLAWNRIGPMPVEPVASVFEAIANTDRAPAAQASRRSTAGRGKDPRSRKGRTGRRT